MARTTRPSFVKTRRPTFIKAWRKSRNNMSQDKLAERLENEVGYAISVPQLSRIERGEQAYTQDLLEAIATVLTCSPADLIMRDPSKPDPTDPDRMTRIMARVPVERRQQALDILETFTEKTGTDN